MTRKKKKDKIVRRNPLINNPLYRKQGKHQKKRKRDLQNEALAE